MEKYMKILGEIRAKNISITKLYLLDCLEADIQKAEFCYDIWLHSDFDMSLGKLADVVNENWKKIQNDEMLEDNILDIVLNF